MAFLRPALAVASLTACYAAIQDDSVALMQIGVEVAAQALAATGDAAGVPNIGMDGSSSDAADGNDWAATRTLPLWAHLSADPWDFGGSAYAQAPAILSSQRSAGAPAPSEAEQPDKLVSTPLVSAFNNGLSAVLLSGLGQHDGESNVTQGSDSDNAEAAGQSQRISYQFDVVMSSILGAILGIFVIMSITDVVRVANITRDIRDSDRVALKQADIVSKKGMGLPMDPDSAPDTAARNTDEDEEFKATPQTIWVIMGLTVYRLYTGFLSATWLPYLLAMEGAELWRDNQALFMGIAKLIYGMSILLTPFFGLMGDRLASKSHALGRRFFVRLGIIVAGLGIFLCHWAAPRGHFWWFGIGVLIWRIGEGLNDVTTEAICPEMLPPEQFEISSAIRASMFLVGGLIGYVMVAVFAHIHYSWLYYAYLIMMFSCGIPPLLLINKDCPRAGGSSRASKPFFQSCIDAYQRPARFPGGFPMACACIFIFSCGTAPMFFMLLMLRDLVGIENNIRLQTQFSLISIDFFLSAAVAAILSSLAAPSRGARQAGNHTGASSFTEIRVNSFRMTAASVIGFGVVALLMPYVSLIHSLSGRELAFYILTGALGACFGCVFSRFQDCNWQLLPPGVETANAMGFSTMCKLLGAGLGNFAAGLILDAFQDGNFVDDSETSMLIVKYKQAGYIVLCAVSAVLAFVAGTMVLLIPRRQNEAVKAAMASRTLGEVT